MPINVTVGASSEMESGDSWAPSPGVHKVAIRELVDAGMSEYKGKSDHRGIAVLQLLDPEESFDLDGSRVQKDVRIYFSIGKGLGTIGFPTKTTLRKLAEAARGQAYTDDDLRKFVSADKGGGGERFDPNVLEGRCILATIEHVTKNTGGEDRVYGKVVSFARWPKDEKQPASLPAYRPLASRGKREQSGGGGYGGGNHSDDELSQLTGGGKKEDDDIPF